MSNDLQIRPLLTTDMLREVEGLQRAIWGRNDVVSAPLMRAGLHGGALVAGAFVGRELVGFVYGFPALPHEPGLRGPGMHSHMAAVLPEARGLGLGRRLKWYQRRWCLERGMAWCTWTFDPLQAGNARLNLHHLGAVVHEFQADFYGVMGDTLSGDFPSHRYVALWDLRSDRVRRRARLDGMAAAYRVDGDAEVEVPPDEQESEAVWALARVEEADAPAEPSLGLQAAVQWQAVPKDVVALRRGDHAVAAAWADAIRDTANDLVARGYEADAFVDGAYRWVRRGHLNE